MIILPAIDIQDGRCVRASQGSPRPEVVYDDNPVEVARRWSHQGARWLHVIDLDGASAGHPVQLGLLRLITAVDVPVQAGGGFLTLEAVEAGFAAGAARVLLDTAAPGLVSEATIRFGDRVCVSLAVSNGRVAAEGSPATPASDSRILGRILVASGIRRLVYRDVARDGTLGGPDLPALAAFVQAVAVPVIAAGGVASLADLMALERLGVEGVIVGRALYEGRLDLRTLTGHEQARPQ